MRKQNGLCYCINASCKCSKCEKNQANMTAAIKAEKLGMERGIIIDLVNYESSDLCQLKKS